MSLPTLVIDIFDWPTKPRVRFFFLNLFGLSFEYYLHHQSKGAVGKWVGCHFSFWQLRIMGIQGVPKKVWNFNFHTVVSFKIIYKKNFEIPII